MVTMISEMIDETQKTMANGRRRFHLYACARPWCVTFEKTGSARARSPTRPSMTKLTFHYRWLGPILGLRLAIKTQAIVSCLFLSNLHFGFLERYVLWGQNKKALLSRVGLDFEREEKKKRKM